MYITTVQWKTHAILYQFATIGSENTTNACMFFSEVYLRFYGHDCDDGIKYVMEKTFIKKIEHKLIPTIYILCWRNAILYHFAFWRLFGGYNIRFRVITEKRSKLLKTSMIVTDCAKMGLASM